MEQTETRLKKRIRRMTKTAKVLRALRRGMSVPEVIKRYDVHPSLVYAARKQLREEEVSKGATIIASSPGITALAKPTETPTNGIGSLTLHPEPKAGSVVYVDPSAKLSLWARFKNWAFGIRS